MGGNQKKWIVGLGMLIGLGVSVGCGGDSAELVEPNAQSQGYIESFEGYESWFRMSDETPTLSAQHGGDYIITYGNELAENAIEAEEFPFPAGTIVVKEQYGSPEGSPRTLSVMVKESDQEGDWYWLQTDMDRMVRVMGGEAVEGNVSMCAGCHGGASDTDRVFLQAYGLAP